MTIPSQQTSYRSILKVLNTVARATRRKVNKVHTRIIRLRNHGIMLFAAISCSSYLTAQANTRLPIATFNQLAARCAPNAAVDTLGAVALTESALHPYALSLNYPATVAAYNGLHNQEVYLTRQPATLPEAITVDA
jgi:hypothetical protein